jgi:hypothetical protein
MRKGEQSKDMLETDGTGKTNVKVTRTAEVTVNRTSFASGDDRHANYGERNPGQGGTGES